MPKHSMIIINQEEVSYLNYLLNILSILPSVNIHKFRWN